jgi:YgiT-type zinc finger domain-containing protein
MNCALCKANLTNGKVNHIVDLGERIIIVKNVPASVCKQCGDYFVDTDTALKLEAIVEEAKKNKAEVLIVRYNDMVA